MTINQDTPRVAVEVWPSGVTVNRTIIAIANAEGRHRFLLNHWKYMTLLLMIIILLINARLPTTLNGLASSHYLVIYNLNVG